MEFIDKFKNLMVMAAADGVLTDREIDFLSDRSAKWGIDDKQFGAAIEYALSETAKLVVPETAEERMEFLSDMIRMMAADGQMADIEKNLFAAVAARLKVSDDELNAIIDSVVS